jgi:hypothetical protein
MNHLFHSLIINIFKKNNVFLKLITTSNFKKIILSIYIGKKFIDNYFLSCSIYISYSITSNEIYN